MPKNLSELLNQGQEAVSALAESLRIPAALRSATTVAKLGVALTVLEGCPKNPDLTMKNDISIEKQDMAEDKAEALTVEMAKELDRTAPLTAINLALDAHSIILDLYDKQGIIPTGNPEEDVYYVNISYLIKEYLQNGGTEEEGNEFIEIYKETRRKALEKQLEEENAKMKEAEPNKLRGIPSAERIYFAAERRIETIEGHLKVLGEYEFPNFAERSDENKEKTEMGKYEKEMREFISRAEKIGTSREEMIEKLEAKIAELNTIAENEKVDQMDLFNARDLAVRHKDASAAQLLELKSAYQESGSTEARPETIDDLEEGGVVYDKPNNALADGVLKVEGGLMSKHADYSVEKTDLFKWEHDPIMLPMVRSELLRMALEIYAREIMAWEEMNLEDPKKFRDFDTVETWRKSLATASARLSKVDRKVIVLSEGNFGSRKLDLDKYLLDVHKNLNEGSKVKYRLDSLEMFRKITQMEAVRMDTPAAFEKLSDDEARSREIALAKDKPCYLKNESALTTTGSYLCNGTDYSSGEIKSVGIEDMIEADISGDKSLYFVVTGYKSSQVSRPYFIPDISAEVKLNEKLTQGFFETIARDEIAHRLSRGELTVATPKAKKAKPEREEEEED